MVLRSNGKGEEIMPDPTPENAPDGLWEEFGKFAAGKLNLFDEFVQSKKTAPAPDPNPEPEPPVKRKGWFSND